MMKCAVLLAVCLLLTASASADSLDEILAAAYQHVEDFKPQTEALRDLIAEWTLESEALYAAAENLDVQSVIGALELLKDDALNAAEASEERRTVVRLIQGMINSLTTMSTRAINNKIKRLTKTESRTVMEDAVNIITDQLQIIDDARPEEDACEGLRESDRYRSFGGECYVFFDHADTWDAAREACEAMEGWDFPTIFSEEQQQLLADTARNEFSFTSLWTGARQGRGAYYWWTSGEMITDSHYTAWDVDQPTFDYRCVMMQGENMRWTDLNCDSLSSFACQYQPQYL